MSDVMTVRKSWNRKDITGQTFGYASTAFSLSYAPLMAFFLKFSIIGVIILLYKSSSLVAYKNKSMLLEVSL